MLENSHLKKKIILKLIFCTGIHIEWWHGCMKNRRKLVKKGFFSVISVIRIDSLQSCHLITGVMWRLFNIMYVEYYTCTCISGNVLSGGTLFLYASLIFYSLVSSTSFVILMLSLFPSYAWGQPNFQPCRKYDLLNTASSCYWEA